MRGAVIPTSVYKGNPTTFTLRRGYTVPTLLYQYNGSKGGLAPYTNCDVYHYTTPSS